MDNKQRTHQDILPPGVEYKEKLELANLGEIEIEINDNSIAELDKYKVRESHQRFFMWPDFIPEDQHGLMFEAMKLMRRVNKAVIQDLEDHIIGQGMEATRTEFHDASTRS